MFWTLIYTTMAFWGSKLLKTSFENEKLSCYYFWKLYCYHICVNYKKYISENSDDVSICITCVQTRSVYLQSNITNYWPGMNNTAFLVIVTDPCNAAIVFWHIYYLHVKLFKHSKELCFQYKGFGPSYLLKKTYKKKNDLPFSVSCNTTFLIFI